MIVTCSTCSKRYLVDSRALGAAGRNVRCAACGNTWFQTPPEDAPQFALASEPAAPSSSPAETERRGARAQLPAVPPPRGRSPLIGWGIAAVVVITIVAGVIFGQPYIMSAWPPAAKLYAMIGRAPTMADLGLRVKFSVSRNVENGVPIVAVDGDVTNVSAIAREVPKLRVALHDGNDHELQAVDVAVTDQRLLPGASMPFHTTISEPSEAATTVVATFAGARN